MAISELVPSEQEPFFSDEDRMAHLSIYAKRQFGVEVEQLGTVEMRDGSPVLVIQHDGKERVLTWSRHQGGVVGWHLDGSAKHLPLGEQGKALGRLLEALG